MDNAMWIRETTRRFSPLTIDRGAAGLRFPMLRGATGRAYLAFCPADEREQILTNLQRAPEAGNELISEPERLAELLQTTRTQGYGHRFGEPPPETGAIAVPVVLGTRVLGCVNLTFMARTLTPTEAARRHLSAMTEAAQAIAEGTQCLQEANEAHALHSFGPFR
jgi:IclR family transcriptional regulator, mhp operon transcriptional activator